MALIELDEVKERLGIDPTDTRYDDELEGAIEGATAAIVNYTERDFGTTPVDEQRTFDYDGTGYVDIDDASEVTAVTLGSQNATDVILTEDEWRAMPRRRDDAPVYTYLCVPGFPGVASSPEMGFTRNLDVLYREGRYGAFQPFVKVDGSWGWEEVPGDVKQAALWTIEEFRLSQSPGGGGDDLQSEAIEGFSRSWNRAVQSLAIPNKARDLLVNYARWNV